MRLGKKYFHNEIENFCNEKDFIIEEFGPESVGQHFIVCKHQFKDITISFIYSSQNKKGSLFECIYTNL